MASTAGPAAGTYPIDTGVCELSPDRISGGWLLTVNGAQSSHIDPSDPMLLEFEYMRQMAAVVDDLHGPESVEGRGPGANRPLRVLHLGAAACALPRYLHHRHPVSRQVAVEVDAELARLVRSWFDLPRAPHLRIRVGDAREVVGSLTAGTRDVVVRDAFAGDRTPAHLTTLEFTRQVHRLLDSGGVYLANCGDSRDLRRARSEAATIAEVFATVALIADPAMFKGRRTGNIVVLGTDRPWTPSAHLVRTLLSDPLPARMVTGPDARAFASGAVLRDPQLSSEQPTPGSTF